MSKSFDNFITIAKHLVVHHTAGRDETDPRVLTNLRTEAVNLAAVLDPIDAADPADELSERALLVRIGRLLVQQGQRMETLAVSLATDVQAAAAEVGASAIAAADRVIVVVGQVRTELATAIARIEELIAAGSTDEAALTETLTTLQAADAKIDSIEPAPVEPPVEPVP